MTIILDGSATGKTIRREVKERTKLFCERTGVQPVLAAVLAGTNPASMTYVSMKERACAQAGIGSRTYPLPAGASQQEVEDQIHRLNDDASVHGILVQHPLPSNIDEGAVLSLLSPSKDVDGIAPISMGMLLAGMPAFHACTPEGMMELMRRYDLPIAGKHAVVVGRSVIVGKPMAVLLLAAHATVTICHSRTPDLKEHCRRADILVAAVGKPEMITADMVKPGAVVLDAGYNRVEGRTTDVGDVHFDSVSTVASAITPVPGGVGPMTIALLLSNTIAAAERATVSAK